MNDDVIFDWSDVGRMEIRLKGNFQADISFYPSDSVIRDTLHRLVTASINDVSDRTIKYPSGNKKDCYEAQNGLKDSLSVNLIKEDADG